LLPLLFALHPGFFHVACVAYLFALNMKTMETASGFGPLCPLRAWRTFVLLDSGTRFT
jgi:hypothetical protein